MKSRPLFTPTQAWVLICAAAAANGSAIQLRSSLEFKCWTADGSTTTECPLYGPDGPWQTFDLVPNYGVLDNGRWGIEPIPVFPDGDTVTELMSDKMEPYMYSVSQSIRLGADNEGSISLQSTVWGGIDSRARTTSGTGYTANIGLFPRDAEGGEIVNASIVVFDSWTYEIGSVPTRYNATVGKLGLGPVQRGHQSYVDGTRPGLLNQLKSTGAVTSEFWSLHLGSAWLRQSSSLVLGGYEQNRVLGDVAVFDMWRGIPRIALVDIFLGVEMGSSPFDGAAGSLWRLVSEDENPLGEEVRKKHRAPPGSISIIPNPSVPFISLPPSICNAIAARLPVTWRDSFGLFTWDVDDPRFKRIVDSPAYLGFVFSDWEARNHTIKIPFKLLNLTLEAPIVDAKNPTRYFPCQPMTQTREGIYQLGRAFLQGAFVGFNYEKNVVYLAQGPGPNMAQSVLRTLEVNDDMPRSNTIDSFAESWMASWTVLESDSSEGSSSGDGDADGQGQGGVLSAGAKAGAAVGAVCGLVLVVVMAGFFWRRTWRRQQAGRDQAAFSLDVRGPEEKTKATTAEAPGTEMRHELEAPLGVHELTTVLPGEGPGKV
ncbi:aspartic peptidase domain-containing protein [Plectosphaerella plurivora]|uniref:Aspartic peptidase domain-containing protein n=1 Tax=Plectosphaerella plurivora TaxID=936078 RepID=A0A9P9A9E7_9PEZI|nr:aspartic peptidase domain-containing protein [Plectosphaerella plurivora]